MKKVLSIVMAAALMLTVFTACGSKKQETPELTSETLANAIIAARNEEDNQYNPPVEIESEDANIFFDMLGFTKENYKAGAMAVSLVNIKAYGVVAVLPAEGKAEDVKAELNAHVENIQKSFEQYLQDQYEVAKAAIVEELDNGVVVMVMCEDAQEVYEKLVAEFAK